MRCDGEHLSVRRVLSVCDGAWGARMVVGVGSDHHGLETTEERMKMKWSERIFNLLASGGNVSVSEPSILVSTVNGSPNLHTTNHFANNPRIRWVGDDEDDNFGNVGMAPMGMMENLLMNFHGQTLV